MIVPVPVLDGGGPAPATSGEDQQVDADSDEQGAGDDLGHRDHQLRSGERTQGQDGAQRQDAGRVGEGDDGPELQGLAAGAPLAHQVGGHDGLAVPGCERVQDAEQHRGEQGHDGEGEGQVGATEEAGEGLGHPVDPAGGDLVHVDPSSAGAGGADRSGANLEAGRRDVRGGLQEVLGVGGEEGGRAVLRHGGPVQRAAPRDGCDLPPAVALASRGVVEGDRGPRPGFRGVAARDPRRVQAGAPGTALRLGTGDAEGSGLPVDGQRQG